MLSVFKNKKQFTISQENKTRIESEIEKLLSLSDGIYAKVKETPMGYYIKIIIDRNKLNITFENEKANKVPESLTFLLIIDYSYPEQPPKILAKTNFCFPSLMDGRNLSNEIITSYDPTTTTLYDIAQMIPKFVKKVLNLTSYYFYGSFSVGAVYDLKNFNNMLVSSFPCRIDYSLEINNEEYDSPEGGYTLILSDDCLVLFENFETDPTIGKVAFWATLYAITDIQINKNTKIVKINFYSEDKVVDKQIRLHIMNVLFFREALVKRMHNLKVKIEENKLHKGHLIDKRLTQRDISSMTISQIEQNIQILKKNINNNELSYYVINTFSILCGKAIEYYSANGDDNKKSVYLNEMKTILLKPDVQVIMQEQH